MQLPPTALFSHVLQLAVSLPLPVHVLVHWAAHMPQMHAASES